MLRPLVNVGLLGLLLLAQEATAIRLWDNTDSFSDDVPTACQNALTFDVKCANYLVTARDVANGAALVGDLASQYCTQECHDSIDNFQRDVHLACGTKAYQLFKISTARAVPADTVNGLMWAYRLSCIQDVNGYCLARVRDRTETACSDCVLKYGAVMVSSDYGRGQLLPKAFSSLLSSCNVPASSYTYEYTSSNPTTTAVSSSTSSSAIPTPTCTGKVYVVKDDDTCQSISKAQSISTDRLIEINHLDYSCSLLTPGTELCIDKTCTVSTVQANQTCEDIVRGKPFGLVQLMGWNPTIHQNCGNLKSMVGRSICISPLGGGEWSLPTAKATTTRGLISPWFTSWVPAEEITMTTTITTSWYWPIYDPNYIQQPLVGEPDAARSSLIAERIQYCWLTDDQLNGFDFDPDEELSSDCLSLYETYCDISPTDPVPNPPLSSIPQSCTPNSSSSMPESSTPVMPTSGGIVTPPST